MNTFIEIYANNLQHNVTKMNKDVFTNKSRLKRATDSIKGFMES